MITLFLSIISLFYLTTYIIYIDKFDSTFKKVPKLKFINQLFQLYSNHLLINKILLMTILYFLKFPIYSILFYVALLALFLLNLNGYEYFFLLILCMIHPRNSENDVIIAIYTLIFIIVTLSQVVDYPIQKEQDLSKSIVKCIKSLTVYFVYAIQYVYSLKMMYQYTHHTINWNNLIPFIIFGYLLIISLISIQTVVRLTLWLLLLGTATKFNNFSIIFSLLITVFSFQKNCQSFFNNETWEPKQKIKVIYAKVKDTISFLIFELSLLSYIWNYFNLQESNLFDKLFKFIGMDNPFCQNLFLFSILSIIIHGFMLLIRKLVCKKRRYGSSNCDKDIKFFYVIVQRLY